MLAKKILSRFDKISFAVAKNGVEALELLNNEAFDLVLLDLFMPILDGFETLERIQNSDNQQVKNTRVIILTADEMPDTIKKVKDLNVSYMPKPLNISMVEKLLEN